MPDPAGRPAPVELERVASETALAAAARLADRDAGPLVRELLIEATPGAGLPRGAGASTAPTASLQWVVAPLERAGGGGYDGSRSAISIAAAVDGEVVAGAVVDVLRAERFSAHLGGGARRDGEPISVSASRDLAEAVVATGSGPTEPRARQDEVAPGAGSRAHRPRLVGSPAVGLCWVGCGRLDGYFERGLDVRGYAAAALIAQEAGAVTELACPENDGLVIAATPRVFDALRAAVELPVS